MIGIFGTIGDFISNTQLPQQFKEVDPAIFKNPWFLVPIGGLLGWMGWKQAWRDIILVVLLFALWYISGTEYMHTLIVDGELQIKKILPVMFGGAAVLGLVIYMFFGRSD